MFFVLNGIVIYREKIVLFVFLLGLLICGMIDNLFFKFLSLSFWILMLLILILFFGFVNLNKVERREDLLVLV